jgi:hypothetical protein
MASIFCFAILLYTCLSQIGQQVVVKLYAYSIIPHLIGGFNIVYCHAKLFYATNSRPNKNSQNDTTGEWCNSIIMLHARCNIIIMLYARRQWPACCLTMLRKMFNLCKPIPQLNDCDRSELISSIWSWISHRVNKIMDNINSHRRSQFFLLAE